MIVVSLMRGCRAGPELSIASGNSHISNVQRLFVHVFDRMCVCGLAVDADTFSFLHSLHLQT